MKWLIKNAKVYDANSPLNEERHTFLVQEGRIQAIDEQSCPSDVAHIEGEDLGICPSWFDLRAHFCDPGQEHKEDLLSGLRSAAAGGYTDVALLPDTSPVLQDREQFQYLYKKARPTGVQVHMVAALTRDQEGEQLCDLLDLRAAGAVAFSDGLRPLDNPQLLTQALRYLAPFGGLIMHRPQSTSLATGGCMHEGRYSTAQGLPAVPAHAEEIMVYSGLRVLEYTGGRLHFSCLSSAGSLRLLEEARAKGLDVSCDVAVHQLLFEDRDLQDFSPNYRVNPPFRANIDRRALLKGVANKQIQAIVSDHHPRAFEEKMRPFSEARAQSRICLQSGLSCFASSSW